MTTTRPSKTSELIKPYGGELKDLLLPSDEAADLLRYAETLPSLRLSQRSICDLELLAIGAFSPLDRFMGEADYRSVVETMRLREGTLFPVPITLPVSSDEPFKIGMEIALRDAKHVPLAVMRVEEIYEWNPEEFARGVLGTASLRHPVVLESHSWGDRFVSGPLRVIELPRHYDFPDLRLTPWTVRQKLSGLGSDNVVAFQTRNPLHRAHEEMIRRAIEETGGVALLHPVVGMTKPGDVEYYNRVRTYKILAEEVFGTERIVLALLPLAMRLAGPREAVLHALIRRNYGANHFIVGRDHASPGADENGEPFYPAYAARDLLKQYSDELGVNVISFDELVFIPESGTYEERSKIPADRSFVSLSGTEVRENFLDRGERLPEWFVRPEVADVLEESFPARHRQGVCLWFTGLSAAGKSTIAEILTVMLTSHGRRVTLLDGDVVRSNLSAGLGFDRAGRDANIRRIGYVASEIVRHRGVAICAAISPYRETRDEVRKMIGENFIEIYVATPLAVCEERDPKGLYARARRGELSGFTGIDDVYEPPASPDITVDTIKQSAEEIAESIFGFLTRRGFLRDEAHRDKDE